jgi:hypothetical protein
MFVHVQCRREHGTHLLLHWCVATLDTFRIAILQDLVVRPGCVPEKVGVN